MIGELGHQRLGHLPQGRAELKGPGQPLPDALEQADLLPLPHAAAPGHLTRHDHDAGDLAALWAQRHSLRADEGAGAVGAQDCEGALPRPAAQDLARQVVGLLQVALLESQRKERPADEMARIVRKSEQPYRKGIRVLKIAQPVGDDNARLGLVEDRVTAKPRRDIANHGITRAPHRTAAGPRVP